MKTEFYRHSLKFSWKSDARFLRYSSFSMLNYSINFKSCDVTISLITRGRVHFWIYLGNWKSFGNHLIIIFWKILEDLVLNPRLNLLNYHDLLKANYDEFAVFTLLKMYTEMVTKIDLLKIQETSFNKAKNQM